MVVECSKRAAATAAEADGRASARSPTPGRPFFLNTAVRVTSSAPAAASAVRSGSYASGCRSSISQATTAIRSSRAPIPAASGSASAAAGSAASPSTNRSRLGRPPGPRSRAPAP